MFAQGVEDEALHLFGPGDEAGLPVGRVEPLAKSDDHVDAAQSLGYCLLRVGPRSLCRLLSS